jgi:hypothetical protein
MYRDRWGIFDGATGRFSTYNTLEEVKEHIESLEYDNGDLYVMKVVEVFEDGEKRDGQRISL